MQDEIGLSGRLKLILSNENGDALAVREFKNLVVTAGKNYVASRIAESSSSVMSHMAIGTGSSAAAAGDTALGTESARVALTSSTVSTNTVVFTGTFGAGTPSGSVVLREAGILNASSSGTLLCRTVFDALTKGTSDTLTIEWTITAG